jgi:hypothetical protein
MTDLWLTFWVGKTFEGWSDVAYIVGLLILALIQTALMSK